jgi:hypothetical protein
MRLRFWHRSPWLGGLARGAIAAASKLLSELITNPPPAWQPTLQTLDGVRLTPDTDSFSGLLWSGLLNNLEGFGLVTGDFVTRNLLDFSVALQRQWSNTVEIAAGLLGDQDWAAQLRADPVREVLTPGVSQAAWAAWGRSEQMLLAAAHPDPQGAIERTAHAALNLAGLGGNLADAVVARARPDSAAGDRQAQVAQALGRAEANLARIKQDLAPVTEPIVAVARAAGRGAVDTAAGLPARAGVVEAASLTGLVPPVTRNLAPADGGLATQAPPGPSAHSREPAAIHGARQQVALPQAGRAGGGLVPRQADSSGRLAQDSTVPPDLGGGDLLDAEAATQARSPTTAGRSPDHRRAGRDRQQEAAWPPDELPGVTADAAAGSPVRLGPTARLQMTVGDETEQAVVDGDTVVFLAPMPLTHGVVIPAGARLLRDSGEILAADGGHVARLDGDRIIAPDGRVLAEVRSNGDVVEPTAGSAHTGDHQPEPPPRAADPSTPLRPSPPLAEQAPLTQPGATGESLPAERVPPPAPDTSAPQASGVDASIPHAEDPGPPSSEPQASVDVTPALVAEAPASPEPATTVSSPDSPDSTDADSTVATGEDVDTGSYG